MDWNAIFTVVQTRVTAMGMQVAGALVLFILVLLLLVFRPTGLLGREVRGA